MAKQWVKHQVRHNEVQDFLGRAINWGLANRRQAGIVLGSAAGVLLLGGLLIYRSRSVQSAAWDRLALAQTYAYSGRPDAALQQIKDLSAERPAAKATAYGQLFAGDLLYHQGSYKEAVEAYAKILEREEPKNLVPLALADTAISLEASGQFSQAAGAAQRFLENHSDHFLAPQVHACMARSLQALGQIDQAKATYQKMSLQYPDTGWAGWAQARLNPPAPLPLKK